MAQANFNLHFQIAPGKALFDNKKFSVRTDFADSQNFFVQAMDRKGMKLD
jgi:hypothetical protein